MTIPATISRHKRGQRQRRRLSWALALGDSVGVVRIGAHRKNLNSPPVAIASWIRHRASTISARSSGRLAKCAAAEITVHDLALTCVQPLTRQSRRTNPAGHDLIASTVRLGRLSAPDFALYCAARFVSAIAVQMQNVAIGWLVYDITGDPFALGLVGLVAFLPSIGLALSLATSPTGSIVAPSCWCATRSA